MFGFKKKKKVGILTVGNIGQMEEGMSDFFSQASEINKEKENVFVNQLNDTLNKMMHICNEHMDINDRQFLCAPANVLLLLISFHRDDVKHFLRQ